MTYTILFATGENTRTGICYAANEETAKQKLFKQHPNATLIKIHKGNLCFEAETIDGIAEDDEPLYMDEDGKIYFHSELETYWEANASEIAENSGATTFAEYLSNCLSKNGSLKEVI